MKSAIIGGTGVRNLEKTETAERILATPYGEVTVFEETKGEEPLVFLPRHARDHRVPPHLINYRANIAALRQLGVQQAIGIYAVGSITSMVLPGCYGIIDQFIDFSGGGRETTFSTGNEAEVRHIPMVEPYSRRLRVFLAKTAHEQGRNISLSGTYVCTNGPRLETPAEISMFRKWGADYVGMTAATETILAGEAGIDFAGLAYSVNWAAGLDAEGFSFIEEETSERVVSEVLGIATAALRIPGPEK